MLIFFLRIPGVPMGRPEHEIGLLSFVLLNHRFDLFFTSSRLTAYCPSWSFIICSIFAFIASRLNVAGDCIGG